VREYGIPKEVLAEAYGPGSTSRVEIRESLRKVRNLLTELGLVTTPAKRLWKAFGIWDEPAADPPGDSRSERIAK
jgi:hypothetical protein